MIKTTQSNVAGPMDKAEAQAITSRELARQRLLTDPRARRQAAKSDMTYDEAVELTERIKEALKYQPRRKPAPLNKKQSSVLYRCFNDEGRLLYVGISLTAAQRLGAHRNSSGWWYRVANIKIEHFDDRDQAREAEKTAIRLERPVYNIEGRD